MKVKTINPATEEVLAEYDIMSKEKVNDTIKKSKETFVDWKKDFHKRIEFVHRLSQMLII